METASEKRSPRTSYPPGWEVEFTGGGISGLEGVPGLPGAPQDEAGLTRKFETTSLSLFTFMHWRRKWQPTPVFLPGESQGRGAWWAAVYLFSGAPSPELGRTSRTQLTGEGKSTGTAQGAPGDPRRDSRGERHICIGRWVLFHWRCLGSPQQRV